MISLRSSARRALETTLLAARWNHVARRSRRGRVLVLAYHNVIASPAEGGADASLHLPLDAFIAQVDALRATHRVIGLREALANPPEVPTDAPAVAITFDDAYAGAIAHAVPVLRDRGLPATLFVPPGRLGGQAFWWDEYRPAGAAAARDFRARALSAGAGRSGDVAAIAARAGIARREVPATARTASAEDLDAALADHPGLSVGSHSWSHPNLVRCAEPDLARELAEARDWLAGRYGSRALPVVSYPYGLADARVERAARAAGHRRGLRIDGGWLPRAVAPFRVPRLNVPAGVGADGFRLRIDGVLAR